MAYNLKHNMKPTPLVRDREAILRSTSMGGKSKKYEDYKQPEESALVAEPNLTMQALRP